MFTLYDPLSPKVQAVFLRGHLKLHSKGLRSRVPPMQLLKKASKITGKEYKRGQYAQAAADLQEFIDAS